MTAPFVPLTRDQIVELLKIAQSVDNRDIDEPMTNIWHAAAVTQRWTAAEAAEAITRHLGEDTAYLTPAHITQRIRHKRRLPPPASEVLALGRPVASAEVRRRALAEFAAEVASRRSVRDAAS